MTNEMATMVEDACVELKEKLERHSDKTVSVIVLAEVNGEETNRASCVEARRAAATHMAIELVTEVLSGVPEETMHELLRIVSQQTIKSYEKKKALAERQL